MAVHPPEEIDAGAVVVRRWRVDDAPALHEAVLHSLDHLRPFMPWVAAEPVTLDERRQKVESWSAAWEAGDEFTYAVTCDEVVVGAVGAHRRIGPGGLEIGYWTRDGWTGRGIARAAAAAVVDAALALDGTTHVEIRHDVANHRSRRIPEALGFVLIGERDRPPEAPAETGIECLWRRTR